MNLNVIVNIIKSAWRFRLALMVLVAVISACTSKEESSEKYYSNGIALQKAGEIEKARLEFLNAIQRDPQNAKAYYQLGLIARDAADLPLAFENIAIASQLDDNFFDAKISLAQMYVYAQRFEEGEKIVVTMQSQGEDSYDLLAVKAAVELGFKRLDSAESVARSALQKKAKDPAMYGLLAAIAQEKNQPQEVLSNLNKAIALSDNKSQYLLLRAALHRQQKDLEALEEDYRLLIQENPDDDQYIYLMARLLLAKKQFANAETLVTDFIKKHPGNVKSKQFHIEMVMALDEKRGKQLLDSYIAKEQNDAKFRLFRVNILAKSGSEKPGNIEAAKSELLSMLNESRYDEKTVLQIRAALAEIIFREGKHNEGIALVIQNLKQDKQHEYSHLLKAEDDLRRGEYDAAISSLRTILRNNPNSEKGLILLGRVYNASGSNLLADDAFRQALEVNPRSVDAAMPVARKLLAAQDFERSDALITQVLQSRPDDVKLLLFQSQIKILKKDWKGAETTIGRLKRFSSGDAYAEFMLGQIDQGQGNCTAAVARYQSALGLNPSLVSALRELSVCFLIMGKELELLAFLQGYQKANPTAVHAYLVAAQLHRARGRLQRAIDVMNQGLRQNPDWIDGYALLAGYKQENNETLEAITVFKRGIRANPEDDILPVLLAGFYQSQQMDQQATHLYQRILARSPDNLLVINNYASLLLTSDKKDSHRRAMDMVEPLKSQEQVQFLDTYGWALYKNARYPEAETYLRKAAEAANQVAEIQYHFGLALQALERIQEAQVVFKRAAKLDAPEDIKVRIRMALEEISS